MEQVGTEEQAVSSSVAGKDLRNDVANAEAAVPALGSTGRALHWAPLICSTVGLNQDIFKICKEYLRPFKRSLRKLHLPQQLSRKKKLKYMKESVTIIGDRINLFLQQHCRASEVRHWKKMMWRFASLFSDKDEKQLQKLYKYIQRNKMQKFQLLCCPLESEDPDPGRKLNEITGNNWAAAGDAVEAAATPTSLPCRCPAVSPAAT
ncbi:uncharacterized protein C17orf64 homolog [Coturnix japonica]|uniref:uncharacterized protein C17orf64 homolog n=1 Tax=Coturnix japonica TaxID=93934 RepID=UPI0013A5E532|nr:uncharacterized protein C17orf64 homolog [Coturnix japonica]XP_015736260.2 uncharacterized protein C17orf64 homolog [Coturnix japonica]